MQIAERCEQDGHASGADVRWHMRCGSHAGHTRTSMRLPLGRELRDSEDSAPRQIFHSLRSSSSEISSRDHRIVTRGCALHGRHSCRSWLRRVTTSETTHGGHRSASELPTPAVHELYAACLRRERRTGDGARPRACRRM